MNAKQLLKHCGAGFHVDACASTWSENRIEEFEKLRNSLEKERDELGDDLTENDLDRVLRLSIEIERVYQIIGSMHWMKYRGDMSEDQKLVKKLSGVFIQQGIEDFRNGEYYF